MATGSIESTGDHLDDQVRTKMVIFLRDLASSIENRTLESNVEEQVSEFFLRFNMGTSLLQGLDDKDSEDELIKFLSLGWFVYSNLLPDQSDENTP
jgi:hypothetical protein